MELLFENIQKKNAYAFLIYRLALNTVTLSGMKDHKIYWNSWFIVHVILSTTRRLSIETSCQIDHRKLIPEADI